MYSEKLKLSRLFEQWAGEMPVSWEPIPGSGSYRRYTRLHGTVRRAMGVINHDVSENLAFISFTKSFHEAGFPVPGILGVDEDQTAYLLEDLGDMTLFARLEQAGQAGNRFSSETVELYRNVLRWLPRFQVEGAKRIDFGLCYPRPAFDRQSMMWDLNYFKYYFLKLARIPFDEQKLEDDFSAFTALLEKAGMEWFMYRDFQSRNIMIQDGKPWFIDYQGGRRGPLQYDLASLLFDAKADMPPQLRDELLSCYLDELEKMLPVNREEFRSYFYGFVLVRILQALGAYGFRGYYENKPHFLRSIPYAMRNLLFLLENDLLPPGLPVIREILSGMVYDPKFTEQGPVRSGLNVRIFSFSYRKGIPADPGENGGGFVFDCRALPNPGKFLEYRSVTGKDEPVIRFLEKEPEVDEFLNHVYSLVDQSVKRYISRDFTNLMVSFGCTGGQHRSVFCAQQLAAHLGEKFQVSVAVTHMELPVNGL